MIQQRGEAKAPLYKSGQERRYTREHLDHAYMDLRYRIMLYSNVPTKANRRRTMLKVVANDHRIAYHTFEKYTEARALEENE